MLGLGLILVAFDAGFQDLFRAIFSVFGSVLMFGFAVLSLIPVYYVSIASAAGEAHALQSTDKTYIQKIVNSINEAIVSYSSTPVP